jgi:hypothetical protein
MTRWCYAEVVSCSQSFIPFLTGSKTPTSRVERNKEDKWEITARKDPISFANHQWGMKRTPTDGSLTLFTIELDVRFARLS